MNRRDYIMSGIIDIVIDCCRSGMYGNTDMTREKLLGRSRNEDVCMARAIFVSQLISAGYTISTISRMLNRTVQGIRHIIKSDSLLRKSSRAYNATVHEVEERCKDLLKEGG